MKTAEFQLRGVDDPRLAIHATSSLPAWLWAIDGTRIVWANPVGARVFGAANAVALAARSFGPADPHRRQMAQLARRLPPNGTVRLERLRGFGAVLGALSTCGCARLDFADGESAVMVVAAQPVGRPMPLVERLRGLVDGINTPIAAFARDGLFIDASAAARALLGFANLANAGLDQARNDALQLGRSETPIGIGHMVLQRVGVGADVGLVALLAPSATAEVPQLHPDPEHAEPTRPELASDPHIASAAQPPDDLAAQPADAAEPSFDAAITASGEAPAEFALHDEAVTPLDPPTALIKVEPAPAPETASVTISDSEAEFIAESETELSDPPPPVDEPAEPSPDVEAAAGEPQPPAFEPVPAAAELDATAWDAEFELFPRRHPLRFVWQMDADGHFSIGTDEFTRLIGPRTAAGLGRGWNEIADIFGLDPERRVAAAVATRKTWSGIKLHWPVDDPDQSLTVELAGLPVLNRDGEFVGYRGFGVCRDLDMLARLAQRRREQAAEEQPPRALSAQSAPDAPPAADSTGAAEAAPSDQDAADLALPDPDIAATEPASEPAAFAVEIQTTPEHPVETPKNVLPFRAPPNDPRSLSLTAIESSAFNELARQLSARLDNDSLGLGAEPAAMATMAEPPADEPPPEPQPDWLTPPTAPARGESSRDKLLFDLMPVGVLIYRLDRLLYANRAFLERMRYDSLQSLEEAGGLDALLLETGVSDASSTSDTGTPVTIAAPQTGADEPQAAAADGHLFTISWDGDQAMALIFSAPKPAPAAFEASPATAPSDVGAANAEELAAIIDTTAEGVVMFDAEGHISCCNRSAEALFGYDGADFVLRNLADLFAPESQRAVQDYFDGIKGSGAASLLDHGREVLGRVREGGLFPLTMTIGRTRADGPNFFAVFRDLTGAKKTESDLAQARRQAERAASAKADVLARISHEVRTPLNAIIGFAEVMIEQRFGALGNERYVEYLRDIRASGERVIAIVNDLLDLSRIETGKLDLAFESQDLNDLVEQCVAVMQPQANRARIIIRTSLAHLLPPIVADAQALRQIALNLIGTSIHLANAGGQVIVSTALSDFGEVVLRVRDTGNRLNAQELAAALEPFGHGAPSDHSASSGVSLSLTKALIEANRAQFHIKTAPHSGTLIEVVFAHTAARV